MSQSVTPTLADPSPAGQVGTQLITIITLASGLVAHGAALWMYLHGGDSAPLIATIGLLLGKFSTAVDFWLGSSSGSQKKDSTIAALIPPAPPVK